MKRVLILGKGYIGTSLNAYLEARNIEITHLKRAEFDYTNPVLFQRYIKDNLADIELVINCSGYTGAPNVDGCELNKQDCWFWNVIVPRNIVLSANTYNIPVIQVSSGCIYNGYEKEYTEKDEPDFGIYSNVSSFYSKCKHACETILQNCYVYILRIRMPFDGTTNKKNYLNKLFKYNKLISLENSLTSVQDLCEFIFKMLFLYKNFPAGPINVVNSGRINAQAILEIFKKYGVTNPSWEIIDLKDLNTVANRSNCVLSDSLIQSLNCGLPPALQSLERDISEFSRHVIS